MIEPRLPAIQDWVRTRVSNARFKHIQGVAGTAEKLALRYGLSRSKARWAAWFHDCGKEMSRSEMALWLRRSPFKLDRDEQRMPGLWHPHVGAAIALKKGVGDPSVLEAIRCHTLGKAGMGPLAQLIFVADFIEPGRRFPGVQLARKAAHKSLREGVLVKSALTIQFLFEKKMRIHPRLLETWNYYLAGEDEKN